MKIVKYKSLTMRFFVTLAALALYSTNALRVTGAGNHLDLLDDWNSFVNSLFGNNDDNATPETSNENQNNNN